MEPAARVLFSSHDGIAQQSTGPASVALCLHEGAADDVQPWPVSDEAEDTHATAAVQARHGMAHTDHVATATSFQLFGAFHFDMADISEVLDDVLRGVSMNPTARGRDKVTVAVQRGPKEPPRAAKCDPTQIHSGLVLLRASGQDQGIS